MPRLIKSFLVWLATIPIRAPKRWSLARGMFSSLPVLFLAYLAYQYTGPEPDHHRVIRELFENNSFLFILAFLAPFAASIFFDLYEWFARYVAERDIDYFPEIHLAVALSSLNIIVGRKLESIGSSINRLLAVRPSPREAFLSVVNPADQIEEIIHQLWAALSKLMELKDLKVVLVKVENDRPTEYVHYMPLNDRPTDDLLKSGHSFFHSICSSQQWRHIPNIAQHIARQRKNPKRKGKHRKDALHFHVQNGDCCSGSIAGIPIRHSHIGKVVYVLTFKSNTPDVINSDFERKFRPFLRIFTDRILLEHSQLRIREHIENQNEPD